jgi:dipeptide/tripeptide permease
MHWSVLIPPSLFLGVGPLIVMTATLEFISAQSPQSMKGFLIGLFFAIRGLFQLLNSIIIIPLSLKRPWASGDMLENPPVTNCGFVYLLFTCVVGSIGLILFSVAAKKYKYRQRDEGMFCQHDVEEIYDRYLTGSIDDSDEH